MSLLLPPSEVWGLRRYDLCGCSQDYVRDKDQEHPLPKKADGVIRKKEPDPNCRWCGGTGKLPGMETVWAAPAEACEHEWTATPPRRSRREADEGNLPSAGNYEALGGRSCSKCGAWLGSLGLEPTPFMYVDHIVEVMGELWPVMRDDGVVFMEIGDTYLTHPAGVTGAKRWKSSTLSNRDHTGGEQAGLMDKRQPGMREGNLALVPHRVAIALQAEGWIVRQDNVWNRRNPMPESVKNRTTRAHSYVFHLAKEPGYYYDQEAVREAQVGTAHSRGRQSVPKMTPAGSGIRMNESYNAAMRDLSPDAGRNLRSVWTFASRAFKEAHYATFPERIPEIAILAGTSERGACPDCGTPWKRVVSLGQPNRGWQRASGGDEKGEYSGQAVKEYEGTGAENASNVKRRILAGMVEKVTIGWTPTCSCYPDPCDRCDKAWIHATVRKRISLMNIRVRDAKKGTLALKSGLGGESADATEKEIEAYGGAGKAVVEGYKIVEVDVSWPSCECRKPVRCVVLDPFAGSGTSLAVAKQKGRRSVGIELSAYYVDMAQRRVAEARTETEHHPNQSRLTEFREAEP